MSFGICRNEFMRNIYFITLLVGVKIILKKQNNVINKYIDNEIYDDY